MRNRSLLIIFIILLPSLAFAQELKFTKAEQKLIRKCNTARFSVVHGRRMKEFIRLMNLARKDGKLLRKYVRAKYGDNYADRDIYTSTNPKPTKWNKNRPLLRPSTGLHLGAFLHGIYGGLTGHTGHMLMDGRAAITLNFLAFMNGNALGENCAYGDNSAIGNFTSLMESSGHRANILNHNFFRVGVSKKYHSGYRRSCVTMLSGKKIRDLIFPFLYRG